MKRFYFSYFLSQFLYKPEILKNLDNIGKTLGYIKVSPLETVKKITDNFREAHSEIPWQKIAGMRDNLIHEYFQVDLQVVWDTAKSGIPGLKKQILNLLET